MDEQSLTSFIEEVCGESHLRVEDDLGGGFVRLRSSEAERRQAQHDIRSTEDVVIEMLRNARDAHARSIFVALTREGPTRRICMIDDGDGVPPAMQMRIFEPRVTSKLDTMHVDAWGVHGRGMALFSIASNVQKASIIASDKGLGAAFIIESNVIDLPEKVDQSQWPTFALDEAGEVSVRGPRNINRMVAEFAQGHHDSVSVYCGSTTSIAATLYAFGQTTVSVNLRAFGGDLGAVPVAKRLCFAGDPLEFAEIAQSLGLDISDRSARRIMDNEIKALSSVAEMITIEDSKFSKRSTDKKKIKELGRDARGLKIDPRDVGDFSHNLKAVFADLAERYYLEPDVTPDIRITREGIQVNFPISKLL